MIRMENPDIPILITAPGDCFMRHRINGYIEVIEKTLLHIAKEKNVFDCITYES